jgi:hypothetical protein
LKVGIPLNPAGQGRTKPPSCSLGRFHVRLLDAHRHDVEPDEEHCVAVVGNPQNLYPNVTPWVAWRPA